MEKQEGIPEVNEDDVNWSTYSKGKKVNDSTPYGLFIDPKVVCSDPKAKVC